MNFVRRFTRPSTSVAIWAVLVGACLPCLADGGQSVVVSIVSDDTPGPAATHGLHKITAALKARGIVAESVDTLQAARGKMVLVSGLASGDGPAARLCQAHKVAVPATPEALAVRRLDVAGKPVVLVAGFDDRGLMYAALDVAGRIAWSTDKAAPFARVRDATEKPYVPERALSIYTMHRACFEARFFDEAYWARYLDMLAANRFNTFVLIFGYENAGYFAPPYPFLFEVDGFADVRVVDLTPEQRRKNLDALNRLIEMTHARGMNFTLGIWDHIYRGGVQGPTEHAKRPTPGVVWGLNQENLVPYTTVALKKLLQEVPDLDAIQFRMHGESGLRRSEMEAFWTDVYRIMKAHGRDIRFDARAKNFPDVLIDRALEIGVPIRICTKYWMEQMGMPFHPTHVHPGNQQDRRHGYADLLRYPKRYDMHWRLWNAGTTRVLLWGDPDYVRRFAESTHLYNGQGFEVTEPMGTKMQDHPHDLPPFELLNPRARYYDWEFERYWHFYQVFGRVGYNPDTPSEIWQEEFQRRFGEDAAGHVEQALHRASRILPRIVAYQYPYHHFPTTRGWVERQRQEDLPNYAKALPSDTEQFQSVDSAARDLLSGEDSAKMTPEESSRWFALAAADVLASVEQAEKHAGARPSKEFRSTMVDLRILAQLALYHAHRARAGVRWALFNHSRDVAAMDDAIAHETRAVIAWRGIVTAAGDVYTDDLMMGRRGSDLSGHWRDELVKLEAGLEKLKQQRKAFRPELPQAGPLIAHVPVRKAKPEENLLIRATVAAKEPLAEVRLHYQRPGQPAGRIKMKPSGPFVVSATIPASEVVEGLSYWIDAVDRAGLVRGSTAPLAVTVSDDDQPPLVQHAPITSADAEKPLAVTATVHDPSGVKWVRLRYRSVTQREDYRTLPMTQAGDDGPYRCVVPAEHLPRQWDFMYFIEVMDNVGNGTIHPDLEKEAPYVVVPLLR